MKPCDALAQLKNVVNIEWYIGKEAAKAIEDACAEPNAKAAKAPTKKA